MKSILTHFWMIQICGYLLDLPSPYNFTYFLALPCFPSLILITISHWPIAIILIFKFFFLSLLGKSDFLFNVDLFIKNHQKQGEWISSERLNPYRLKATEKTEMKNRGRHWRLALSLFLIGFQSVPIWPDELSKRKKKTSRHTANKNFRNQKHIRSGVFSIYSRTQDRANLLQQQTLTISHSTSERRLWLKLNNNKVCKDLLSRCRVNCK